MRLSLQPAKPVLKREDSPPEALKALQRMKARDSTVYVDPSSSPSPSPAATSDTAPSATPVSPSSYVPFDPFSNNDDPHNGRVAHMRASTSYLAPSASSFTPASSILSPLSTHNEKDDVLGYNRMTQAGIRKHVHMLDRTKLEAYLTNEEFERVLGMPRVDFGALPKWKQDRVKREKALL